MLFIGYQGTIKNMETLRAAFCFDQNLTAQVQVAVMSLLTAFAGEDVRLEIHCVCTEEA